MNKAALSFWMTAECFQGFNVYSLMAPGTSSFSIFIHYNILHTVIGIGNLSCLLMSKMLRKCYFRSFAMVGRWFEFKSSVRIYLSLNNWKELLKFKY